MQPIDHNTKSYFVRKPFAQFTVVSLTLLTAFFINRTQKSLQGKTFENHIPTKEMWEWYGKHTARQGENEDIVTKDHSVNIIDKMGRFDKRDEIDSNPFYTYNKH